MKRIIDKSGFALLAIAILFAWTPSAEARPHLPRKAARGAVKVLKRIVRPFRGC